MKPIFNYYSVLEALSIDEDGEVCDEWLGVCLEQGVFSCVGTEVPILTDIHVLSSLEF